jgi:hypothetical protein
MRSLGGITTLGGGARNEIFVDVVEVGLYKLNSVDP